MLSTRVVKAPFVTKCACDYTWRIHNISFTFLNLTNNGATQVCTEENLKS